MSESRSSGLESSRRILVKNLARVEGEGSLHLRIRGDQLETVELRIFEPPRFFEAFLEGRSWSEAPDLTARICGICPVAYQMSTVHAVEEAFGCRQIPGHIRELRRLLYCGEWIQSHVLHVLMLHAPDFFGLPHALALAQKFPGKVGNGLQLKKVGNGIMDLLGGRSIHPINVRVGGFSVLPQIEDVEELLRRLKEAEPCAMELLQWVSRFDFPDCPESFDDTFVALLGVGEYPLCHGQIGVSDGREIPVHRHEEFFVESQVPHSTALHARLKGHGAYLTGPLARYALNFENLPVEAQDAAREVGLAHPCVNPFRSIQVRLIEVLFALSEARRICEKYVAHHWERQAPHIEIVPRQGVGYAATEAPRGILYHRLEFTEEGLIRKARIVPPTSQNQARIEDDLYHLAGANLHLSDPDLQHLCEQAIRNYDPCISCSAHFLKLRREDFTANPEVEAGDA